MNSSVRLTGLSRTKCVPHETTTNGTIGTIEPFDEERNKHLVRVNDLAQHYFADDEFKPFTG